MSNRPADLSTMISERLHGVSEDLTEGERVIVKIVERCGCNAPKLSAHHTRCHICNGTGFVIDAMTLLPPPPPF